MLPSIEWIVTTQRIGGRAILLRMPQRPESVLANVVKSGVSGESDPYWGFLWPSATVLAELILARSWPCCLQTLELGCGSGLVGLAALCAGHDVTFSDLVPEAAALAQENAVANGFSNASSTVLDWRDPTDLRFDLILASDVLYHAALHQPLAALLSRMLSDGGECWMADPGRSVAREFLQALTAEGLIYCLRDEAGLDVLVPLPGRFVLIVVRKTCLKMPLGRTALSPSGEGV